MVAPTKQCYIFHVCNLNVIALNFFYIMVKICKKNKHAKKKNKNEMSQQNIITATCTCHEILEYQLLLALIARLNNFLHDG